MGLSSAMNKHWRLIEELDVAISLLADQSLLLCAGGLLVRAPEKRAPENFEELEDTVLRLSDYVDSACDLTLGDRSEANDQDIANAKNQVTTAKDEATRLKDEAVRLDKLVGSTEASELAANIGIFVEQLKAFFRTLPPIFESTLESVRLDANNIPLPPQKSLVDNLEVLAKGVWSSIKDEEDYLKQRMLQNPLSEPQKGNIEYLRALRTSIHKLIRRHGKLESELTELKKTPLLQNALVYLKVDAKLASVKGINTRKRPFLRVGVRFDSVPYYKDEFDSYLKNTAKILEPFENKASIIRAMDKAIKATNNSWAKQGRSEKKAALTVIRNQYANNPTPETITSFIETASIARDAAFFKAKHGQTASIKAFYKALPAGLRLEIKNKNSTETDSSSEQPSPAV